MAPTDFTEAMPAVPPAPTAPLVVAEADLYAVEPERLVDRVMAHAEWLAVEYVAFDGGEQSRATLASLLPDGSPLPGASPGTQVFVDWARASEVAQTGPMSYRVTVLVRSLSSTDDAGFTRQPTMQVTVDVGLADDGAPVVTDVPGMALAEVEPAPRLELAEVPDDVLAGYAGKGEVIGGSQTGDGSWRLVVMEPGPDGVMRPVSIRP
jgi:hypothetical protein